MKVNLGAIGKGYAAKIAMDVMTEQGVDRAAISTGGDTYLLGRKTIGPWIVGIEHPRETESLYRTIRCRRHGRGDFGRRQEVYRSFEEQRYGHILDPTHRNARHGLSKRNNRGFRTRPSLTLTPLPCLSWARKLGMNWVEAREGIESLIHRRQRRILTRSSGWSTIAGLDTRIVHSSTKVFKGRSKNDGRRWQAKPTTVRTRSTSNVCVGRNPRTDPSIQNQASWSSVEAGHVSIGRRSSETGGRVL